MIDVDAFNVSASIAETPSSQRLKTGGYVDVCVPPADWLIVVIVGEQSITRRDAIRGDSARQMFNESANFASRRENALIGFIRTSKATPKSPLDQNA